MKGIFITGTDTGVGKTYLTALLTRTLRKQGIPAIALKPVASGDRSDAKQLSEAMDGALPVSKINPVHFATPLAPYAAGLLENRPFPWDLLRSHWKDMTSSHPGPLLVEGVGGWRVPMDSTQSVREWARELGLPVLVVCRATLGTLNHTLLTVDSIRNAGLPIPGVIMNFHGAPEDDAVRTNPGILEEWSKLPVAKMPAEARDWEIPGWLRSVLV
ncbi:dethiobiotin synthase [bacterium]|nr:dethiobiotin synthase [bacterium]NDD81664.1 dethiobiotin synthase [Verrucomicrobiota bacterium]